MKFLDKYPECRGCPVTKYCGKMVSSRRLCNSYNDNVDLNEKEPVKSEKSN